MYATFNGTLTYTNLYQIMNANFKLNLKGVQGTKNGIGDEADPTLATLGNDADGVVSATVVSKNTVSANAYTGTYDGLQHSISNVQAGKSDSTLSYSTDNQNWTDGLPQFTDAGTYTVYVKASHEYNSDVTTPFTVTISKRNVTLTSGSATKAYDGTPLTDSTVAVTGDGFAAGEGAVYTVTGGRTTAGISSNTFSYTLNANTDVNNYSFSVVYGTLTVRGTTPYTNTDSNTTNTTVDSQPRPSTPTTSTRPSTPSTGDQTNSVFYAGMDIRWLGSYRWYNG